MKIAVMSNITIDIVVENIKKKYKVYSPSGFNTWQMEVIDDRSGLYAYEPEVVFIILYLDRFEEAAQSPADGKVFLENWLDSIRSLKERMKSIPIFVTDLDLCGIRCEPVSSFRDLSPLEAYWTESIQSIKGVYILSVRDAIREMGRNQFYFRKLWYMGSSPYSLKGAKRLSDLMMQYCENIFSPRKKCLVVDLDNTLWGGVIGEVGTEGIELSNYKEGARFYDAQKCLKRMKDNGVMLAVASKNNLEDVIPVFKHPFMYLKKEDFVSLKINWNPKEKNLREMADELNIGLDAFVFLDDNPNEREQIKAMCPEVSVIEFPKDTSMLPAVLEDAYDVYFRSLSVTDEDRSKTKFYRQNNKRKEIRAKSGSVKDYLRNLEITADIHLMKENEIDRVVQLIGKTNQFNTTTIRYSKKEVQGLSDGEYGDVVVATMKDKYGDEGLTAIVIIRYLPATVVIDDFIMSCRVMGRKFEDVIMKSLVAWMKRMKPDIRIVQADYIKTAKNKPVEALYDHFGFKVRSTDGVSDNIGYKKQYCAKIMDLTFMEVGYKKVIEFEDSIC